MAFDTKDIQVQDIFNDRVFKIPRNQRKYVWDKVNWAELMSDLQFVIESNNEHFLGSIVLTAEKNVTTNIRCYSIIDGQQRIVTSTIIICVLAQIFLERSMKSSFDSIKRLLIKNDIIDASKTFCIIEENTSVALNSLIKEIYGQDTESVTPTDKLLKEVDDLERNIKDCFMFFYDGITDFVADDNSKLLRYYEALLNIRLVSIEATTEEDSYTIFEILNARGVELEDYELLKNFIMRYYTPKDNIDVVKERWLELEKKLGSHFKSYIQYYAIHKYYEENSERRENRPYKIISKNIKTTDNVPESIRCLLDDLEKKADFYKRIVEPSDSRNNESERMIFSFLNKRRQRQFRPLILGLMSAREDSEISVDLYNKSLNYLFVFFVSYNIIGEENSNKIQDIIHKHSKKIGSECNEDKIIEFKRSIEEKLPENENFKKVFCGKGFSSGHHQLFTGSKKADIAKIVLMLREFLAGGELDLNFDFTIEHIVSDAKDRAYLYGNLLPLEEELNKLCHNKPIELKLPLYKKSKYKITRDFVDTYNATWQYDTYTENLAEMLYSYFESKIKE